MKQRADPALSRRAFLGAASAATAAAAGAALAPREVRATGLLATATGEYPRVALRSETVTVGLLQTRSLAIDGRHPEPGRRRNLEHLCSSIDAAQADGVHKDWLAFHELPLSGWDHWSRRELARVAIELPGPECVALAAKAREHDCYVSFGAFARDPAWPRRVLSVVVFLAPDGEIIAKHWRLRRVPGTSTDAHVTTIEDVLDEFLERHGIEEVAPVARTAIGNLAATAIADAPELYRALALKGAEFILRMATGATPTRLVRAQAPDLALHDMALWCRTNRIYGGFVNSAMAQLPEPLIDAPGAGGSALFGTDGRALAEARGPREELISARLPLAEFRLSHRPPAVSPALAASLEVASQRRASRLG